MSFFFKMLNSDGNTVKKFDKAMWLVVGTDPDATPRMIADRDRSIAGPALRAFMDCIVYERYVHPYTTTTRHFYAWVDVGLGGQNVGAEEVDTVDGFKTWQQMSLYAGLKSLSSFQNDPKFPSGARLRLLKHACIKILLEDMSKGGFAHKIYIAHKRTYIEEGQFLDQMGMVLDGEGVAALEIRNKKIGHSTANRTLAHTARAGNGKGNSDQVAAQTANGLPEPVDVGGADPVTGEVAGLDSKLIMIDYNTGKEVNMFDLPAGYYGIRVRRTRGDWGWNPELATSINEWRTFAEPKTGYKIDLAND